MKKNRSKAAHHAFLQRVDAEYREKLARKAEKRKVKNEKKIEAKMDVDAVDDDDIDLIDDDMVKNKRPLSTRDKMAKRRRERRDRLKIKVVHGSDSKMRDDDDKKNKKKSLAIKKDISKVGR
ncbi:hypothetical protein Pmar_PMAR021799 [Perkinsus marinus ATCC 50983]|uniref:Uncharacterized protein n=1 Tax=Perkinsus marinus (strain ATCC 50983 / TXsc) TaxID=423536 RepID=C5LG39_PERM5|nr:hypothetical protein Pmar_PMAR021799 [Perkinsus marinus ATCC 50983]EER04294.1 hypothetical protein Pmar_PMAR021799 [Perkinsus marinus ATCC 50983]|eukprot:XP_002772478.1 hypothetical protein Pmar_PMAR021799 [Perkinsus marinus ATCC 50983]